MSIIHKALKKAEGAQRAADARPIDGDEMLMGGGPMGGSFNRIPMVRVVLLVLLVAAVGFAVYRLFFAPKPPADSTAVPVIPNTLIGETGHKEEVPTRRPAHPENAGLPASVLDFVEEGEAFFEAGQYEAAIQRFTDATKKEPEMAMLWNNIGLAQRKLGNHDKAAEAYDKALAVDPKYAAAMNNMGMLKLVTGDRLSATLYFRKATETDPLYADAHFNLAVIMEEEGNWQSAVEEYKQFLDNAKTHDAALLDQVRLRIEEIAP